MYGIIYIYIYGQCNYSYIVSECCIYDCHLFQISFCFSENPVGVFCTACIV